MIKRLLIAATLLAALGGASRAQADQPVTETVLGAGAIAAPFSFDISSPADVVVAKAVVQPGGNFGWHYHRAAVAAVVQSGTLTLYDGADRHCRPQRFTAGHGFVEQRRHVHLARNEGRTPVVVLVTYLGLRHGVDPDVPVAAPGNCPF